MVSHGSTKCSGMKTKFLAGVITMFTEEHRPGTPDREKKAMKRQLRNRVFGLAAGTVAFGAISACGGSGGGGLDIADGGIRAPAQVLVRFPGLAVCL